LLARALESALRQEGGVRAEIVVAIDGCADAYRSVRARYAGRVRFVETGGEFGSGGARNIAVRASHGQIICFLDDDDELSPTFLNAINAAARARDFDFAWCGAEFVSDEADAPPQTRTFEARAGAMLYPALMTVGAGFGFAAKRETLARAGMFDPTLRTVEDTDLFVRLLISGAQPRTLSGVGVRIHAHKGPRLTDRSRDALRVRECRRLLSKYADFYRRFPQLRRQIEWTIATLSAKA